MNLSVLFDAYKNNPRLNFLADRLLFANFTPTLSKEEGEKPLRSKDTVLMLDARKIYRKVTQKVNDFSPEQLQNIICIVNLYRGNTTKFTTTVNEYLQTAYNYAKETALITDQLQKQIKIIVENEKLQAINEKLFTDLNSLDDFENVIQLQNELMFLLYAIHACPQHRGSCTGIAVLHRTLLLKYANAH